MNIVIKLEHKDFDGNKEVFDCLYGLSKVVNKPSSQMGEIIPKETVEHAANINRDVASLSKTTNIVQEEPNNNEVRALPETEAAPSTATTEVAPSMTELRSAFGELARTKGKETAKNILSELGCSKVTEIPEDKRAEAMRLIGEV